VIGFAGATLIRLGPGFGIDERDMDNRLGTESRRAIEAERLSERNIFSFYAGYLGRVAHGDLGFSHSLNRPVTELLAERLPATLTSLTYGAAGGLSFGLLLATLAVNGRLASFDFVTGTFAGLCVSVPSAVLAVGFLWWGVSGQWAIALVVFPQVYRYARNILSAGSQSPHVITALAKGLGRYRIFALHVLAPAFPQILALAGISVTLAFAASIPIEAICDIPGIGQLAWKAALSRDLPLLVSITMLVGLFTLTVHGISDLILDRAGPQ
jgi:ABC-type dipeptide/oligopeptide/nickel transport system permease component